MSQSEVAVPVVGLPSQAAVPEPALAITKPKAKREKAPAKTKKATTHPIYKEMISDAIKSLKERGGSSRQAILKYIIANFQVGDKPAVNSHLKIALKNGVQGGYLKQSKGVGASGSFKLGEIEKPAAKKSPKPKKIAKKTASRRTDVKKAAVKKRPEKKSPIKKAAKAGNKKTAKKTKSPKKPGVQKIKSPKKAPTKRADKPKKPTAKKATASATKKTGKKPVLKKTAKK